MVLSILEKDLVSYRNSAAHSFVSQPRIMRRREWVKTIINRGAFLSIDNLEKSTEYFRANIQELERRFSVIPAVIEGAEISYGEKVLFEITGRLRRLEAIRLKSDERVILNLLKEEVERLNYANALALEWGSFFERNRNISPGEIDGLVARIIEAGITGDFSGPNKFQAMAFTPDVLIDAKKAIMLEEQTKEGIRYRLNPEFALRLVAAAKAKLLAGYLSGFKSLKTSELDSEVKPVLEKVESILSRVK